MDQGPLVNDEIDTGRAFVNRFADYAPVKIAFWLKDSEYGQWYLYVASDEVNGTNIGVAYGEVLRVAAAMPVPKIDPFQVKLVGGDEPITRAVLELQRRHPGRTSMRHHGSRLGDVNVDELYLYAPPVTAS